MSIRIQCENGHAFKVTDEMAGKKVLCPKCKVKIHVPNSDIFDPTEEEMYEELIRQKKKREADVKEQKSSRNRARLEKEKHQVRLFMIYGSSVLLLIFIGAFGVWMMFGGSSPDEKLAQQTNDDVKPVADAVASEQRESVLDAGTPNKPDLALDSTMKDEADSTDGATAPANDEPKPVPASAVQSTGDPSPDAAEQSTASAAKISKVTERYALPDPPTNLVLQNIPAKQPSDKSSAPVFPDAIKLPGTKLVYAFDHETGRLATLDGAARTLTICEPSYFDGDTSAVTGPFDIQTAEAPSEILFKRYHEHRLLLLVAGKKLFLYDSKTLQFTTGDGQWPAVMEVPDGNHLHGIGTSQNPDDAHIYGHIRSRSNPLCFLFNLRLGGKALRVSNIKAPRISKSGRLIAYASNNRPGCAIQRISPVRVNSTSGMLQSYSTLGGLKGPLLFDPFEQFLVGSNGFTPIDVLNILPAVTHPLCVMEQRPWIVGVETKKERLQGSDPIALHFCHRATGEVAAEVKIGRLAEIDNPPEKKARRSTRDPIVYLPIIYDDHAHQRLLVIRDTAVGVLPWDKVSIPDEPLLAGMVTLPEPVEPGIQFSADVICPDSRVKVSLLNRPDGMTFEDNRLEWKPRFDQIGVHGISLRFEHGEAAKTQSMSCLVSLESLKVPFRPMGTAVSSDGLRTVAWNNESRLSLFSGLSIPVMTLIDVPNKSILATREFRRGILAVEMDTEFVYLLGPNWTIKVLSRDDLSDLRTVQLGRNVTHLDLHDDTALELRTVAGCVGVLQLPAMNESPINSLIQPGLPFTRLTGSFPGWRVGHALFDDEMTKLKYFISFPGIEAILNAKRYHQQADGFRRPLSLRNLHANRINNRLSFSLKVNQTGQNQRGMKSLLSLFVYENQDILDKNGSSQVAVRKTIPLVGETLGSHSHVSHPNLDSAGRYVSFTTPSGMHVFDTDTFGLHDSAEKQSGFGIPPLQLRAETGPFVVSKSKPMKVRYVAAGGRPPYEFTASLRDVNYRITEARPTDPKLIMPLKAKGAFQLNGKAIQATLLKNAFDLRKLVPISSTASVSDAVEAYIRGVNDRYASWIDHELRGVPVAIPITVAVTDATDRAIAMTHSLILELPRQNVISRLEDFRKRTQRDAPTTTWKNIFDKNYSDRNLPAPAMPLVPSQQFSHVDLSNIIRQRMSGEVTVETGALPDTIHRWRLYRAVGLGKSEAPLQMPERTFKTTTGESVKGKLLFAGGPNAVVKESSQPNEVKHLDIFSLSPETIAQIWEDTKPVRMAREKEGRKGTNELSFNTWITQQPQAVSVALNNFVRDHGCLPPRALVDQNGRPLLSWRVIILPYLGELNLYQMFRLDEPWDSPHNIQLLPFMPNAYYDLPASQAEGHTGVLAFTGPATAFPHDKVRWMSDFQDDSSQTLWAIYANIRQTVEWTKPGDIDVTDGSDALELFSIYRRPNERTLDPTIPFVWGVFGDQKAQAFGHKTDRNLLLQAIRINDGNPEGLRKPRQ